MHKLLLNTKLLKKYFSNFIYGIGLPSKNYNLDNIFDNLKNKDKDKYSFMFRKSELLSSAEQSQIYLNQTNKEIDIFNQSKINSEGIKLILKFYITMTLDNLIYVFSLLCKKTNKMACQESQPKLYLGCSFREKLSEPQGLYVLSVKTESPAENAGLKTKDLIVEIEGHSVRSINDYYSAIGSEPGLKKFKILREEKDDYIPIEINIHLVNHQT